MKKINGATRQALQEIFSNVEIVKDYILSIELLEKEDVSGHVISSLELGLSNKTDFIHLIFETDEDRVEMIDALFSEKEAEYLKLNHL